MFHQNHARSVYNTDRTFTLCFESFVVRAVFFSFLSHQANVRHSAHSSWVESTILLTELDSFLVDTGITAIRDYRFSILLLAFGIPHLARTANHRWHRRIDDHIRWYMQVSDALIGINHRQGRTSRINRIEVSVDFCLLVGRQCSDFGVNITNTVINVYTQLGEQVGVLSQYVFIENRNSVTENNRVRHLHHGGFHVQREQNALCFSIGNFSFDKAAQSGNTQY